MKREQLVQTLELLKHALAKDDTIPVFQCFVFDDGTISAYNDTVGIIAPVDTNETFAVHGKTFLGIVSNSSAEEVSVNLSNQTADFKLGKTEMTLPFIPKEDFIFEAPTAGTSMFPFTVSSCNAMKLCLDTVSKDETQRALQGITIVKDKMYSCDGDTLTRVQLPNGPKGTIFLPTAFCEAVVNVWDALGMAKGKLGYNDEWCVADFEDWEIWGRIPQIENKIDFEKEIKKTIKKEIEYQPVPAGLSDALKRAGVIAGAESAKTVIAIAKGKMALSTQTHMGEVDDVLAIKGHKEVTATISAEHLARAIVNCDRFEVHDNCILLEKEPDVFMLVSNM